MWKDLYEAGAVGSEDGEVLLDEEYKVACRITLEKCKKYYAITCGVYGAMFHTVFVGEDDCQETYAAMKKDLQEFIDKDTSPEEELDFYDVFTSKYF